MTGKGHRMLDIQKSSQTSFEKYDTAWCPGCGNFGIQNSIASALDELNLDPHKVVLAAGIGQAAKMPQYVSTNRFCGLHGRSVPAASAIKMANDELNVIISTGDGDSYGEGGNHLMAAIRRNINITHIVHDNQVYGLTKGQASPTSLMGYVTEVQSDGVKNTPYNPLTNALALGAGFVARAFSGNQKQLIEVLKAAILYDGYALVDVFQPCVTFNRVNTYKWYNQRVKPLDENYDFTDFDLAFKTAQQFSDDGIPTGIIYNVDKPTFSSQNKVLNDGKSLLTKGVTRDILEGKIKDFR